MSIPTVAESTALAVRIFAIWRAVPPVEFQILERGDTVRPLGVLAHVDHAAKLTDAIEVLVDKGYLVQCVPLIRSAMEAAVTAAWFAVTPGSGNAAQLDGMQQRLKLAKELDAIVGGTKSAETKDLEAGEAELIEHYSIEANKFASRVHSLDGMAWVYAGYRSLSEYTHAGLPLMDHYLRPADGETSSIGVTYSAENEFEKAESCFWLLPMVAHLALSAWGIIDKSHPHRSELELIGAESGIKSVIARRETNRERGARRLAERTQRPTKKP